MSTSSHTPIAEDENFFYYEHIVRRGEDVASIADDYSTTWEYIAQCNELSPPYPVSKGMIIEVPVLRSAKNNSAARKERAASTLQEEVLVEEQAPSERQGKLSRFFGKKQTQDTSVQTFAATPGQTVEPGTELDWMQSDEEQYHDAMREEERTWSRRANTIIAGLVVFFGGLIGWYIYKITQQPEQKEAVSINELAKDDIAEEERQDNATPDAGTTETSGGAEAAGTTEGGQAETVAIAPTEISVQVLNGGAAAGQATKLTESLGAAGYKTAAATNATNNVQGVALYYGTEEHKAAASKMAETIGTAYGTVTVEQNADLVQRVGADLVVILGA